MIVQIVDLLIVIGILASCLIFVCIKCAQMERKIEVLEEELHILKETSTLLSQKCDYLIENSI